MPNIDHELLPERVEGVEYLAELALDLRNTWDTPPTRSGNGSIPSCGT